MSNDIFEIRFKGSWISALEEEEMMKVARHVLSLWTGMLGQPDRGGGAVKAGMRRQKTLNCGGICEDVAE